ncbi:MAG TPA: hypothetical protein VF303_02105 [Candidatus Nanoarchaeia archaeon]
MKKDLAKIGLTLNEIADSKMEGWDYETHSSAIGSLREGDDYFQWAMGKVAAHAETEWGKSIIKELAKDNNMSPRRLYECRQAYKTFGDKVLRTSAQSGTPPSELAFDAYVAAARTGNPQEWIKKAEDEGWSVRQLKRELKQLKSAQYESHGHEWKNWKICTTCGIREEL